MTIFTIGFTKKSAETFFHTLSGAKVARLVDVRLNNVSQLAGFAKRDDLRFFTRAVCGIDYVHTPFLAPTKDMLDAYKKRKGAWDEYEKQFNDLDPDACDRVAGLAGDAGRCLSSLQRREAASLPSPPGCGVPARVLGRCGDQASGLKSVVPFWYG